MRGMMSSNTAGSRDKWYNTMVRKLTDKGYEVTHDSNLIVTVKLSAKRGVIDYRTLKNLELSVGDDGELYAISWHDDYVKVDIGRW